MQDRISIAGDIGSGKTTVAHRLANIVGTEVLSTGGIQRKLAQERGVSVLELNVLAENDPTIDRDIDNYLINLKPGPVVVESRMAWHFVPNTLKVYLYCSAYEATRRIVGANRKDEDYSHHENPLRPILDRRLSEVHRFQKYYQVNINEVRNYDLVIDTTFTGVDEIVERVTSFQTSDYSPICWVNPKSLIPTQGIRDLSEDRLKEVRGWIGKSGYDAKHPVKALYVDHVFWIYDGHARTGASVQLHQTFVPIQIIGFNDEEFMPGITARQYVNDAVTDARVYDWEDAIGFKYQDKIWRGEA